MRVSPHFAATVVARMSTSPHQGRGGWLRRCGMWGVSRLSSPVPSLGVRRNEGNRKATNELRPCP